MKNNMTTIYIVRHGESGGNAEIASDHVIGKGSSLTEKGLKQAAAISKEFKNITFDAIFSSDLERAFKTAEIIAKEKGTVLQTTKLLRERSLGLYLKKNPEKTRESIEQDLQKAFEGLDDQAKMDYKFSENFESPSESTKRFTDFLKQIALKYKGKTILVISHGNLMRTFLVHLGWAKYNELPKGSIKNTGYIIIESYGSSFFIKKVQGATKNKNGKRGF